MKKLNLYIESILFSYAQIFFSNRKWFGGLALICTFFSPVIGISALVGVMVSNFIALFLRYDKEKIRNGFYGFNGILFGGAVAYFFNFSPQLFIIVVMFFLLSFFVSTSLEHFMANIFNLPGLSIPFLLTLYIFLIFVTNYNNISFREINYSISSIGENIPEILVGYFNSLSLILFQKSLWAGILLSVGILVFSRVMFLNTIFAYLINYILLQVIFPQYDSNFLILTSFNSILVSFALGGSLVLVSKKSFILIGIASVFVIIFTGFFSKILIDYLLPTLVLPFNLIVLATIYSLKFRTEQSDFVLLYFKPGSPEENLYYHQNRKSRFEKFKFMFAELPVWGEWKISQGIEGNITHKDDWKYAWDFVIEENQNEFDESGDVVSDYFCFSTPVVSPLNGTVIKVVDNISDNEIGEVNLNDNWGNTVIIDHGEGLFSKLSHLKNKSIKVNEGDILKKGEIIGQCGNSGRSPTPHLHFQFQLTDRVDDKTHEFPISHYIVNKGNYMELKTFDFPKENELVRNIETHKVLKQAYNFQLGDDFEFECKSGNKKFIEKWEVKVDIYNQSFLESDRGAKAYFFKKDKIFLMSDFIGEKDSALFYFYLLSIRFPLGYYKNLQWNEKLPISLTINGPVRFLSEFFLIFSQQLKSKMKSKFLERKNSDSNFEIQMEIESFGKGLFSFYRKFEEGNLVISNEGFIDEISITKKGYNFIAKQIKDK